jgi:glutathione synthase/RimK-type ligase-like ATP-grasp enzyme
MGIRMTAEEMGVDLTYIPFRKVVIAIGNGNYSFRTLNKDLRGKLENVNAVLNRTQSKNRRLYAASILEAFGKYVVNPLSIESLCFSKFRSLVEIWRRNVKIPKTVYIPCDAYDVTTDGRHIHNEEVVADLMQSELGRGNVVMKPDGGTHGNEVRLATDRTMLLRSIASTEPSIINPVGFVAQEFVEKWFYDLRIIVAKERGNQPSCYPSALARAGFKDFRTNTYLGNMVFGVTLPLEVQKAAIACGEAIGGDCEAWVLALDAMLNVGGDRFVDDEYVKSELEKLVKPFAIVNKIKQRKMKGSDFASWNEALEKAYGAYMRAESYERVKNVIENSMGRGKDALLFHEANACPDFWEQTRLIAGVNVAVPLIRCALSVEGWSIYQRVKQY